MQSLLSCSPICAPHQLLDVSRTLFFLCFRPQFSIFEHHTDAYKKLSKIKWAEPMSPHLSLWANPTHFPHFGRFDGKRPPHSYHSGGKHPEDDKKAVSPDKKDEKTGAPRLPIRLKGKPWKNESPFFFSFTYVMTFIEDVVLNSICEHSVGD
ncbi:uncharacterized protein BYT42DRAFT_414707 [Radiomyces spectabilis]|uniref:uncharacterized protein n=1 Tax=Radiomyces spectabilis TaxID=64574 RepID=UPI0022200F00|nr:uncharacterized protein BYT42DRAFT_414707 [Radiomyces spectabilis]KAI8374653.1 hypothetical protein BYT42DRAFT_414707 [Radiomyces spectabilis]